MNKRTWCYVLPPSAFEMACDKCGGINTAWSEFEGMIWCYDCEIDTKGFPGIFDGPIPWQVANMFVSFDRINLETRQIEKAHLDAETGEIKYIPIDDWMVIKAKKLLSDDNEIDEDSIKMEARKYFKFVPVTEEQKEKNRQDVLEWSRDQHGRE